MSWFDSHCHLEECEQGAAGAVEAAAAADVTRILTVATDLATSRGAIEMASRFEGVSATVGVDPQCLEGWDNSTLGELATLAADDGVVAIGEIGLDYFHDRSSRDLQHTAFAEQLRLAVSLDKPVVLHVRDAMDDVLTIIRDAHLSQPVVFHCFSTDVRDARRALDVGGYISFAGNVTFKSAESLREAARFVPLDRLLIETDSPFLTPVPHRGKKNQPAYVVHVGEVIAQARSTHIADVEQATFRNACLVFDR